MDALKVEGQTKKRRDGKTGKRPFPANAQVKDSDDKLSDLVHLPSNGQAAARM
jgi:hypothetical protein